MVSFYEVLGVPRDASEAEIRTAFRAAALRAHPDKQHLQQADAQAHVVGASSHVLHEWNEVQRAYEVLRDARLRSVHDRELDLATYRQHVTIQDEITLDEMEPAEHEGVQGYSFLCRCGDTYWLPRQEARATQHQAALPCPGCSNHIIVDVSGVDWGDGMDRAGLTVEELDASQLQ